MTMTLKQALAFRLPGGKAFGEATPEDITELAEFREKEVERYKALDPATMTAKDRQRIEASRDRFRAEDEAFAVIVENLPEDAEQKLAKIRQARR